MTQHQTCYLKTAFQHASFYQSEQRVNHTHKHITFYTHKYNAFGVKKTLIFFVVVFRFYNFTAERNTKEVINTKTSFCDGKKT